MDNLSAIAGKSLAAILNNLSDGFMIIDTHRKILTFNNVAEQITGYTAAQAKTMTCCRVLGIDDCAGQCPLNFLYHGRSTSLKRELAICRQDGTRGFIHCTTTALTDVNGMVVGAVDVFQDISEIKALEADLKQSEYKYQRLYEGSKDMIFITDQDGGFIDINQAGLDLLDYPDRESLYNKGSVGTIFRNVMHWKVFKEQIRRNGYVKDFEAAFCKKDGTRVHCLLSGNAVKDKQDTIVGYEGIAKDITARMDAYRTLFQRNEDLSLLNSLAAIMNQAFHLDDVLPTVLNRLMDRLNLNCGAIILINRETSQFQVRANRGFTDFDQHMNGSLVFHDTLLEKSFLDLDNRLTPRPIYPSFRVSCNGNDAHASIELICFLITSKQKPSGFFAFRFQDKKKLSREDIHLLGSLGNFLGNAIDSIDLLDAVQRHRENLKSLTAQLFHFQETECKRISRELHDEAGQALIGINYNLEAVEQKLPDHMVQLKNLLQVTQHQINSTYQEMRNISHRLHPALLTDLGLEPALDAFLEPLNRQTGLEIRFRMIGFTQRLHPDIETVLYRFSQEAVTNTIKHARATWFKLSLIQGYPHIIFVAEDDGCGFNPDLHPDGKTTLGLLSMQERAVMLGGKFTLRSSPGNGTAIRIQIPIKPQHVADPYAIRQEGDHDK